MVFGLCRGVVLCVDAEAKAGTLFADEEVDLSALEPEAEASGAMAAPQDEDVFLEAESDPEPHTAASAPVSPLPAVAIGQAATPTSAAVADTTSALTQPTPTPTPTPAAATATATAAAAAAVVVATTTTGAVALDFDLDAEVDNLVADGTELSADGTFPWPNRPSVLSVMCMRVHWCDLPWFVLDDCWCWWRCFVPARSQFGRRFGMTPVCGSSLGPAVLTALVIRILCYVEVEHKKM
jgi:hypothetical protein